MAEGVRESPAGGQEGTGEKGKRVGQGVDRDRERDVTSSITVLGLAGSARRGGNTETLLDWCLTAAADSGAQVTKLRLYDLDLRGCQACDACLKDGRCIQQDDMQRLYPLLRSVDSIVLAAPVYAMGMPGVPKIMIDRCQPFWGLKYVLRQPLLEPGRRQRRGAFLSCAGTDLPQVFEGSRRTVRYLWHVLEVSPVGEALYPLTDAKGDILNHPGAQDSAVELGRRLAEPR